MRYHRLLEELYAAPFFSQSDCIIYALIQSEMEPHITIQIVGDNSLFKKMCSRWPRSHSSGDTRKPGSRVKEKLSSEMDKRYAWRKSTSIQDPGNLGWEIKCGWLFLFWTTKKFFRENVNIISGMRIRVLTNQKLGEVTTDQSEARTAS